MRYFIGNLIRGEAAEYYKATCSDLAARFGIEDVSAIVPPHVKVKTPFERGDIVAVDDVVSLAAEAPALPLTLSKWNHFTTRTIFLESPSFNPDIKNYIREVVGKLRRLGLTESPQEAEPHIHMSVARFLEPKQYELVWQYLESMPAPQFDISFDNLTIFYKEKRDDKAWKVLKTFPMMGKR